MSISACCSLNPLPTSSTLDPTSLPSLLIKKYNLSRRANEKSSSWRSKRLMVIATTLIISLEVGDIISNINGSYNSMANEIAIESQTPKEKRVARWSDKRSCPPWNINSFETIVPEDLPRPSAHRKWEEVSHSPRPTAPSIKPRKGCFSM